MRSRYRPRFRTWLTPNRCVKDISTTTHPPRPVRIAARECPIPLRRWHTTKPLDGCFVEMAGQIRASIEAFRDCIRPTARSPFLCRPEERTYARCLLEFCQNFNWKWINMSLCRLIWISIICHLIIGLGSNHFTLSRVLSLFREDNA